MYKEIYKYIKKYNNIVIARHIGVDPDAMASQIALRDSIKLTFPEKNVYAVGNGSSKFSYIGKLDKVDDLENALLIVVDLPDKKRADGVVFSKYDFVIKIDHHPFIEDFGGLECIDDTASSAAEIIMDLILNTKLECNKQIAETLYYGLVSDSNRFLFNTCGPRTFQLVSIYLEKYKFDIKELYQKMYARPLNEVKLEGYILENMTVTDNGLMYVDITDDTINKYKVDSAAAGNMINNFNFINEILVWATITEDVKSGLIRISIRSRGPVINKVAEKYNGGGHKMASGVKVQTFEEAHLIMNELDKVAALYIKENNLEAENDN
ncbi:MAG: bifunctional oligoribonuclease/PAP phosphatase NrnA [Bacilli bacterium]|nr:bifunctional oligoribonuclease/PAP phosphatase NrnA [Bacilli bacterium]